MILRKYLIRYRFFIIVTVILIFCLIRATKGSDFDIYLLASQVMLEKKNIFSAALTYNVQYFYSPFFALALIPLAVIPFFVSKLLWLLLSTFFWFRINKIAITELKKANVLSKSYWPILLANLVIIGFIIDNYHMIQVTFFILWGTLESIRLIYSNKSIKGSLLLGLIINIKLLPLPFIPYLIYRRKFKEAAITIATFLILLLLPSIFIGWDYNKYLHGQWWETINPSNGGHLLESNILVFNIQALVTNLLTDNNGVTLIHSELIGKIIFGSIFLLALSTLIFLRFPILAASKTNLHQFWEISFLLLVTIIIFPHQNKYATVYILFSLLYIFNYLSNQIRSGNFKRSLSFKIIFATVIFSIVLISLNSKDVVGKDLYLFFADIKSITIGELMLIPVLAYLTPERVKKSVAY